MNSTLGVWEINNNTPIRVIEAEIAFEEHLETWIHNDPSLVSAGLTVVGRQITFDHGRGRLDLLGIDLQGRWVVIEIKRGSLMRDCIAQILDYASCLADLSEEELTIKVDPRQVGVDKSLIELLDERNARESLARDKREVIMVLVGTNRSVEFDRIVSFVSDRFQFPLTIVTFNVYKTAQGNQMLIRELNDIEENAQVTENKHSFNPKIDDLKQIAIRNGIGDLFEKLCSICVEKDLYPRTWKTSVMFTPQSNKTRCLFTVWVDPKDGKAKTYICSSAFSEFFHLPIERCSTLLGGDHWKYMNHVDVMEFAKALDNLFPQ